LLIDGSITQKTFRHKLLVSYLHMHKKSHWQQA
jgi:hypothetical protein